MMKRAVPSIGRSIVTLVLLAGSWESASAAPVVLSFDEFAHRSSLIAQYANVGVTFNAPQVLDYALMGLPQPFAHSGAKGIEQCFATEFCTSPIEMQFTAAQRRVKIWAGLSFPAVVAESVVLTGYDAGGTQVAQAILDFAPAATVQAVTRPLEAVAPSASIVRVTIEARVDGSPSATNGMAIDDIEFDTEGPPPVCNATDRAFVGLVEPLAGAHTQIGSYLLQGNVVTDDPLEAALLTVVGPDGSSVTGDLLSAAIIQRAGGTFGPIRCSPLRPGSNLIRVTVTNCKGSDVEERTVIYDPIPQGTRFILGGIQFMQTIQNLSNHVPLIAGKRTVARVFLSLDPPNGATITEILNVRGIMTATRPDGTPMPGPFSVASLNKFTVSDPAPATAQFRLDQTLNFELPPEWIGEGTIYARLSQLTIEGAQPPIECVGCATPFVFGVGRFEAAPPVRLVIFNVPWIHQNVTRMATTTDFDHLESWLRRVYPTADLQVSRSQLAGMTGMPDVDFDCDDVNARLFQQLNLGGFDPRVHVYGLVDDNGTLVSGNGFMRGCSRGIPSRVASGPAGGSSWGWDNDGSYADWYGGHELAHTYGRKHPGFCKNNSDDDDDYPYSGGRIGNVHAGFDVGDTTLGIAMGVLSPGVYTDVMTYCDDEWISDYTYEGILDRLRAIETSGTGGGLLADALMIQGRIDLVTNAVILRPFLRLDGLEEIGSIADSPFVVELRSGGGGTLASHPFEVAEDTEPEPGRNLTGSFDLIVPWVDGTRRIVILLDGQELARRDVSPGAPEVSLETSSVFPQTQVVQVRWGGFDPDGDSLTYALQYSPVGGDPWIPIETGLTGTGVDVSLARLAGGSEARFRVLATDGVNTTIGAQDQAISVPRHEPRARIIRPEPGERFESGQPIILQGDGYDVEDGHLRGAALRWSSDSARLLGTGTSLSLDRLPPGPHWIGLAAEDSDEATGTDMVEIEVLPAPVIAQVSVDSPVLVGSTVDLDGSASTGQGVLVYSWSLLSKPAGSAAVVTGAQNSTAHVTVDTAGSYALQLLLEDSTGASSVALPTIVAVAAIPFTRGETNGDSALDISDPTRILAWLFLGGPEPICIQAADANDDEKVDLSDATYLLSYLFLGSRAPGAPFPECGIDPTGEGLGCERSTCP